MVTLYGIKNCSTVAQARKWLEAHQIAHAFHDFRQEAIGEDLIQKWCAQLDWKLLLNRRSTTWRKLPEATKENVSADNVAALLVAHPTLIKRPVLDCNGQLHLGFKESHYQTLFT